MCVHTTCESSRLCLFFIFHCNDCLVSISSAHTEREWVSSCQCSYCQLSSFCCLLCINASLIVNYILSSNAIAGITRKQHKKNTTKKSQAMALKEKGKENTTTKKLFVKKSFGDKDPTCQHTQKTNDPYDQFVLCVCVCRLTVALEIYAP